MPAFLTFGMESVMLRFAVPALAMVPAFAYAAVPPEVMAKITEVGADAATIGAAVFIVLLGIWAFKLLRRAK